MPATARTSYTRREKPNPMVWATLGYLFMFIFRPFEYWEWLGELHIQRVYAICLIVAVFFWRGKRYVHHAITTSFIAFFLVMCLSMAIAYRPEAAVREVEEYAKLLVLYFVIILTVRDEKDFRILIIGFIAIMGIYVGKSLWEFLVHGRHFYRMGIRRLIGIDKTYSDPNTFAASIVYSLPIAWALWKSETSKWIRRGLVAYGGLSVVSIMFTGSRSGMVSFIFFLFLVWAKGQRKAVGAILLVISLLAIWQVVPEEYRLRYFTMVDDSISESATESAQGRIEGLKNGIRLFANRPLTGWGAGNFPYAVETIGVFNRMQSHNLYGQLAADLGILGVLSFLAICWKIFLTSRKIVLDGKQAQGRNTEGKEWLLAATATACLSTMLLLLFNGNFGHNLYRYTWLLIGAILVLGQSFAKGPASQITSFRVVKRK